MLGGLERRPFLLGDHQSQRSGRFQFALAADKQAPPRGSAFTSRASSGVLGRASRGRSTHGNPRTQCRRLHRKGGRSSRRLRRRHCRKDKGASPDRRNEPPGRASARLPPSGRREQLRPARARTPEHPPHRRHDPSDPGGDRNAVVRTVDDWLSRTSARRSILLALPACTTRPGTAPTRSG